MKQTPCSARPYIQIYAELMKGPRTTEQLVIATGIERFAVRRNIRVMRAVRVVKQDNLGCTGKGNIKVFSVGAELKPPRGKLPVVSITFGVFVRCLDGTRTASGISSETGLEIKAAHRWVKVAKELGMIRVSGWERDSGTIWQALYSIGNKQGVAKPRPLKKTVVQARYYAASRAKKAMQECMQMQVSYPIAT